MGRGRGKGRKSIESNNEDHGSGEEEKIPVQKRRGRPQKPLKDDIDDEVADKIMDEEEANSGLTHKERSRSGVDGGGKKRKKKEKAELLEEENGTEVKSSVEDSVKSENGHAHSGSRRKGKPCRAAEAWVECS
uniref:Uncharacterized protein n=1 Tax=Kalanchoe fedtschenkoi TaxID=63787 RepID=A0A7N0TQB4_KALFE